MRDPLETTDSNLGRGRSTWGPVVSSPGVTPLQKNLLKRAQWLLVACLPIAGGCQNAEPSFDKQLAEEHNRLGGVAMRQGKLGGAERHFKTALSLSRSKSNLRTEADALNNLGLVYETMGSPDRALIHYDQALAAAMPEGSDSDPFTLQYFPGIFAASLNRTRVLLHEDELNLAIISLKEAYAASDEMGSMTSRATCRKMESLILVQAGDSQEALIAAKEAARLFEIADRTAARTAGLADARLIVGRLQRQQGNSLDAIESFHDAGRLARDIFSRTLVAISLQEIAATLADLGHLDDAVIRYQMALEETRRIPDMARSRHNIEALRSIAERLGRRDLLMECDEALQELDSSTSTTSPDLDSTAG